MSMRQYPALRKDAAIAKSNPSARCKTSCGKNIAGQHAKLPGNIYVIRSNAQAIATTGRNSRGGCYVLHLKVRDELSLAFGGFKKGKVFHLDPGDYAYIGSAMSQAGATCLSRRLLRHATRLGQNPRHTIRDVLHLALRKADLCDWNLVPPSVKLPRWNIDHLLDKDCVDLVGVYAIPSRLGVEAELGKQIENDPAAVVFEKGLGANDIPGNTHILRIDADAEWWERLPAKLKHFMNAMASRNKSR